jgi:hypothetical protein
MKLKDITIDRQLIHEVVVSDMLATIDRLATEGERQAAQAAAKERYQRAQARRWQALLDARRREKRPGG